MNKKKNLTVKIMAILALSAIVISVIGTGILFIYEIYFNPSAQADILSPEEIEAYLQELNIQQEQEDNDIIWEGIEDSDIIWGEMNDEDIDYEEETVDIDISEEEIY